MNPKPVEAVPAWSNQIIFDASKEAEEGIAYQCFI